MGGSVLSRDWGDPRNMAAADSTNLGLAEDIDVPYAGGAVGTEDCVFHNVANCPDCSGGMIRQGGCCFCPECGFESCGA